MRDEIRALVQRSLRNQPPPCDEEAEAAHESQPGAVPTPKTGVQILDTEERKGTLYHTVRDLRNGNVVRNVTRSSARKLWQYAIMQHEGSPVQEEQVQWDPGSEHLGLWKSSKRAGKVRYDLVQRMPDGRLQVYYGVTEDGIDGPWRAFLTD